MCVCVFSPALRMAFLLLLLISATWVLGLMAVNSDVMIFHYLFAIFSCLQVRPISHKQIINQRKVKIMFHNIHNILDDLV